jgi:hypothetical protein
MGSVEPVKTRKIASLALRALHVVFNVLSVAAILFFALISPYDYEREPKLKQVDDDKLLVLRFFWVCCTLWFLGAGFLFRPHRKSFTFHHVYYAGVVLFSLYKVIILFLI